MKPKPAIPSEAGGEHSASISSWEINVAGHNIRNKCYYDNNRVLSRGSHHMILVRTSKYNMMATRRLSAPPLYTNYAFFLSFKRKSKREKYIVKKGDKSKRKKKLQLKTKIKNTYWYIKKGKQMKARKRKHKCSNKQSTTRHYSSSTHSHGRLNKLRHGHQRLLNTLHGQLPRRGHDEHLQSQNTANQRNTTTARAIQRRGDKANSRPNQLTTK